ncbi:MAG: hypothetical protein JSS66_00130 [Armatimonadetes bacterium]|nr:hypothetical protein [Armatimonadota bacterium]
MAQIARPIQDVDMSIWTPSSGGTYWNLIDDPTPDEDSTYIWRDASASPPIPTPKGVLLSTVSDPGVDTGHSVTMRVRQEDDVDVTWKYTMWCGNTFVASGSLDSVNSQNYIDLTYNLSTVQASGITDYSQLKILPEASAGVIVRCTNLFLTVPSLPSSTSQRVSTLMLLGAG